MSTIDPDDRLASLAPTTPPDPDGFAAARAALDAEVSVGSDRGPLPGPGAGPATAPDSGADRPGEPTDALRAGADAGRLRSMRTGDTHVLDLDPHDGERVEVVTSLDIARKRRPRRRRHLTVAAASVGVVGILGTALVLAPFRANDASTTQAPTGPHCQPSPFSKEDLADSPGSWRTLAKEPWATPVAELGLSVTDDGTLGRFCAATPDVDHAVHYWQVTADAPPAGEVLPLGTSDDGWFVLWGRAGRGVSAIELRFDGTSQGIGDASERASGLVAEARTTGDGYWFVFMRSDDVPDGAALSLGWRSAVAGEQSMTLDDTWLDGTGVPVDVAQRRDACSQGWDDGTSRPVVEEERDAHGAALFELVRTGDLVFCVQETDPPYRPALRTSGPPTGPAPAADETEAVVGGGSGPVSALAGRAGDDVARVEVRTADGGSLDAEVVDGYWLVWRTTGPKQSDPWGDATLTWYLRDGSAGGTGPVFE